MADFSTLFLPDLSLFNAARRTVTGEHSCIVVFQTKLGISSLVANYRFVRVLPVDASCSERRTLPDQPLVEHAAKVSRHSRQ
jgi:hypothetical protein